MPMEIYVIAKYIDDLVHLLVQVSPFSSRMAQINTTIPGYINPYPTATTLNQ